MLHSSSVGIFVTLYFIMMMQDGSNVPVAVKTCKSDGDHTKTDQLFKEAGWSLRHLAT